MNYEHFLARLAPGARSEITADLTGSSADGHMWTTRIADELRRTPHGQQRGR